MDRFTLTIDHGSCWGCRTCEVACKQENRSPDGVRLIHISEDGPRVVGTEMDFAYRVNVCRHCDEPECAVACPENAIVRRDDGIVILNEEACAGCGICVDVCPYHAISFDDDRGVAKKCNLCSHRVDRGLVPACADNVCLAHCIRFEFTDKIGKMIGKRKTPAFQ